MLLIKPIFENCNFRFRKALSKIVSLFWSEAACHSLNIKQTFDDTHGQFGEGRVFSPGIFKVTMNMSPAVGCGGTFLDDLVVFVGAVGQEDAAISCQHCLWIHGMFGIGEVVEDLRVVCVAAIYPEVSSECFAESFFDRRHCGGIGLNDLAFEDQLSHTPKYRRDESGEFTKPAGHGCSVKWKVQCFENLLLLVEWLLEPEFIGCYFSHKPRTRESFVYCVVWFLCSDHFAATSIAGVFEDNMLDVFKKLFYKFDLVGKIKTNYGAGQTAARAWEFVRWQMMFFFASNNRLRSSGRLSLFEGRYRVAFAHPQFLLLWYRG